MREQYPFFREEDERTAAVIGEEAASSDLEGRYQKPYAVLTQNRLYCKNEQGNFIVALSGILSAGWATVTKNAKLLWVALICIAVLLAACVVPSRYALPEILSLRLLNAGNTALKAYSIAPEGSSGSAPTMPEHWDAISPYLDEYSQKDLEKIYDRCGLEHFPQTAEQAQQLLGAVREAQQAEDTPSGPVMGKDLELAQLSQKFDFSTDVAQDFFAAWREIYASSFSFTSEAKQTFTEFCNRMAADRDRTYELLQCYFNSSLPNGLYSDAAFSVGLGGMYFSLADWPYFMKELFAAGYPELLGISLSEKQVDAYAQGNYDETYFYIRAYEKAAAVAYEYDVSIDEIFPLVQQIQKLSSELYNAYQGDSSRYYELQQSFALHYCLNYDHMKLFEDFGENLPTTVVLGDLYCSAALDGATGADLLRMMELSVELEMYPWEAEELLAGPSEEEQQSGELDAKFVEEILSFSSEEQENLLVPLALNGKENIPYLYEYPQSLEEYNEQRENYQKAGELLYSSPIPYYTESLYNSLISGNQSPFALRFGLLTTPLSIYVSLIGGLVALAFLCLKRPRPAALCACVVGLVGLLRGLVSLGSVSLFSLLILVLSLAVIALSLLFLVSGGKKSVFQIVTTSGVFDFKAEEYTAEEFSSFQKTVSSVKAGA